MLIKLIKQYFKLKTNKYLHFLLGIHEKDGKDSFIARISTLSAQKH